MKGGMNMNWLNSSWVKGLSILLVVTLLLTMLPENLVAQDFPEHGPPAIDAQFTLKEKQPRTRLGELEEKRDRSKKFFLNSDMTITAEIYPYSIHYDNNGSWEEIDNTIVADESVPELPLRNKANDFIFRLARNFTGSNKLVSVRQGQYSVFLSHP